MIDFLWVATALVGYFSLLAIGLNIQYGLAGLGNFGVAGFFALGAYASAVFHKDPATLGITETMVAAFGLPFGATVALTLAVGLLVAWALVKILDASELNPLFVKVLTLVFAEILYLVLSTQKSVVNGFNGVRGLERPFAEMVGSYEAYDRALAIFLVVCGLLATVGFHYLSASSHGRALRAMRDDPGAVESLGYDIRYLRKTAFVVGSLFMVLAGALWPLMTTVVEPSAFKFEVTLLAWAALVVGGTGSALGPVIGSVLLVGVVHEGSRMLHFGDLPARFVPLIEAGGIGLLMIMFILFRPDGLWRERPLKLSGLRQGA